jgi:hypothetical protein
MSKALKLTLSLFFIVLIALVALLFIPDRFESHADTVIEIHTIEDLNNVRNDLTAHYVLMNDLDFENPASWNDHATNYDIVMNGVTTIEDQDVGNSGSTTYTVYYKPIDETRTVTVKVWDVEREPYVPGVSGGWQVTDYANGQISFFDADGVAITPANLYAVHTSRRVVVTYPIVEKEYFGWLPIGVSGQNFQGTFDGKGYTISNLYINRPLLSYVGLFRTAGGTIRNVGLESVDITALSYVGGLAGSTSSTSISTSYITGSVTALASTAYVGGLSGLTADSFISNSYSTASVTGGTIKGGFIGRISGTTVMSSYSTGLVSGTNTSTGGFNGTSASTIIINCFWDTETSGRATSNQGTGKTTAQMQSLATYEGLWRIVDSSEPTRYVWYIEDGVGYPKLHNSIDPSEVLTKSGEYYLVGSVEDLKIINEYATVAGFKYKLTSNLDLAIEPDFYIPYFIGVFDGDGYAISNLNINLPLQDYVGMFGRVYWGSSITNLGLLNVNIIGANNVGAFSGAAVGVTNSYVTGSITATGTAVGVIRGWQWGVSPNTFYNYDATTLNGHQIFGLEALDQARFDDWMAGGFEPLELSTYLTQEDDYYLITSVSDLEAFRNFGQLDDLKVRLTTNLDLTGKTGLYIPNFQGEFDGSGYEISNMSLNFPIQNNVGFFGSLRHESLIYDLGVTNATVVGQDSVGIFAGYMINSKIWNSYSSGTVTGRTNVGSLLGQADNWYSEVYDSSSSGSVSGTTNVGGLVGNLSSTSKVMFSHSTANVTGIGSSYQLGGLVGQNDGLIAVAYSTGNVQGLTNLGGLVGRNIGNTYGGGVILDSFSHSTVTLTTSNYVAGGLIGRLENTRAIVDRTYSTGAVVGTGTNVRGLIGSYSAGTITNSFWDTESSGRTTSGGGTGKTTLEMKAIATYSDVATVGLDIPWAINPITDSSASTWFIDEGNSYPVLRVINASPDDLFAEENGYYLIDSLDKLKMMGYGYFNKTSLKFKLTTNIDLVDHPGYHIPYFETHLDGNGHTIDNFTRLEENTSRVGFIGELWQNGVVKNLGLTNINVIGRVETGGLVGYSRGTIDNCYTTGLVQGSHWLGGWSDGWMIGGLVGYNAGEYYYSWPGTITNSYSTVSVTAKEWSGGLVGYNWVGTISDSYWEGTIIGLGDSIGGLVGYNERGVILNSHTSGTAIGEMWVGGLVGYNTAGGSDGYSLISNSYSSVEVIAEMDSGGLVGYHESVSNATNTIIDSYATGTVTCPESSTYVYALGGFVGTNKSSIIESSYATGNVSCNVEGVYKESIGGFAGWSYGVILNSHATGRVEVTSALGGMGFGGFIGYHNDSIIENSYSTGEVIGTGGEGTGGFVGYKHAEIINSYSTGSVTGSDSVGGFAGYINNATVETSYSIGSVIGQAKTGGFVGHNEGGNILNSYTHSSVVGTDSVGGFVGVNDTSGVINNTYSAGTLTGDTNVGGFAGNNDATITNSFWDTTTSGVLTSSGGTGKTTVEMKNISTFNNTATEGLDTEWDIVLMTEFNPLNPPIWYLDQTITYPLLAYQNPEYGGEPPPGGEDPPPSEDTVAILQLDGSLSVRDLISNLDATVPSLTFKGVGRTIDLFVGSGGSRRIVAKVTTDLTEDRIWNGVNAGFDGVLKKSYVHNLTTSPGTASSFTLYVPKGSEDTNVRVCLGASSLSAVSLVCPAGSNLDESNVNVSIVEFESNSYWTISNVTGTGGVSFIDPQESPTPVDPPDNGDTPTTPSDPTEPGTPGEPADPTPPVGDGDPIDEEPIDEEVVDPIVTEPIYVDEEEEEEEEVIPVFTRIVERVREIINSVIEFIGNVDPTVATTVAVGSFSLVLVNYVISALSTSRDSSLYAIQLISSIFVFGKLKKKKQNYGIVYDSVTKEPINRAIVRITDPSGKLVTTEVTDVYGIFDATLPSGSYKFNVEAKDYRFPSRVIQVSEDEPYMNVYHGKVINHTTEDILNVSIPMDRIDSTLLHDSTTSLKSIVYTLWNILLYVLFIIGFVMAVVNVVREPSGFLWLILAIYFVFIALYIIMKLKTRKSFGLVRNAYGTLIEGLEIGLLEQEFDTLYAKRVTDDGGKYRFIVPGGKYKLVVLNPEYELVDDTQDMIEVKDGSVYVFNDNITVKKK